MTDLCGYDAVALAGLLRRREVSAREVVAAHIKRIEQADPVVNAIVTPTFDQALAKAAAADDALASGEPAGLLHGLPVAHKDLVEVAGVRTTFGSPLFSDHVPDRDALIVARMSGAGAISLGKTNTPEFGAGSHTVNAVFGATRNPYDPSRSAGGSSGGAAAALAARMVALADGSDLGGCRSGRSPTPRTGWASRGRWGARSPTWRCCSRSSRDPTRGCRWLSTPRRRSWPTRRRSPGCSTGMSAGCGWAGAPTSACRSTPRSGPFSPRPGRCLPTWAARWSMPRPT